MIIRILNSSAAGDAAAVAFDGLIGRFVEIDVLKMTSTELQEAYGVAFAATDAGSIFELVEMLSNADGTRTDLSVRKDQLARLVEDRRDLLPCFVAYQRLGRSVVLPIMSDVVPGKWSLFFEPSGEMTLIEPQDGRLHATREKDLVGDEPQTGDDHIFAPIAARLASVRTAVTARLPTLRIKS